MALSVDPLIARALISTPSRLVGELTTDDLACQIVFQLDEVAWYTQISENPYSRHYYLLSYNKSEDFVRRLAVPSITLSDGTVKYTDALPQMFRDLAAIWFGKRFDDHGLVMYESILQMPDLSDLPASKYFRYSPFNYKQRADLKVQLNLGAMQPALKLLYAEEFQDRLDVLHVSWRAVEFYGRALRTFESDPELSFVEFIIALEVIASSIEIPDDELYDEQLRNDLNAIEKTLGPNVATRIRSRLFQLRRRIAYITGELLNDCFFDASEAEELYRLTRDSVKSRIMAAYDVRSTYVHSGAAFGFWFRIHIGGENGEVNVGSPILPASHREFQNTLSKIPTFVGLERMVRYIILRFAHLHICPLHDDLN